MFSCRTDRARLAVVFAPKVTIVVMMMMMMMMIMIMMVIAGSPADSGLPTAARPPPSLDDSRNPMAGKDDATTATAESEILRKIIRRNAREGLRFETLIEERKIVSGTRAERAIARVD